MTPTETTVTSAKAWAADVSAFVPNDVVPEALILQASTVCGEVEGDAPAVRVMYVEDGDADFVAEGNPIPEADPELAEVVVSTGKVAQLIRLSREQWFQPNADLALSESAQRAVVKRANRAFIAQTAPTAGAVTPPAGILNVAGILDGGAVDTDLDALVDLTAQIEANGGTPSHIIASPTAWAALRKLKVGTGSAQSLLGAGTVDSARLLLDLPVLVTPAVPSGTGLVVDRNAIASAVGPVYVARSEHQYFSSDSIAIRVTWRFGANLVHPDRVGKFTIA